MPPAAKQERRSQTREMINKMLAERQEVLVQLLRVSGVGPYNRGQPVVIELHEFRQILVDYIASAHFGLYSRIVEGNERRQPVLDLAQSIYPRIAKTTAEAVDFSDKYDTSGADENAPVPASLQQDLSRLGEVLATRIELEDQLIQVMLDEHADAKTFHARAAH